MLSPDYAQAKMVPADQIGDAIEAGWSHASRMTNPQGAPKWVPVAERENLAGQGWKPVPFQAPDAADHPPAYGFTPGNIASNAWQGVKDVAGGAYALGKDLASNPNWVTGPDSTIQKFVFAPADVEAQKAKDLWREGRYVEAAGHGLAAGVPLAGPAAAQIGEQIGSGDIGGGIARGGSQALTPLAVSRGIAPIARRAILLGYTPEQAYASALKPSTTIPAETRAAIVNTGLSERIPVTPGGIAKISKLVEDLNQEIAGQIATNPDLPISRPAIAQRVTPAIARFSTQVNPAADVASIERARSEFLGQDFPGSRGEQPGTPAVPPRPTGLVNAQGQPIMSPGSPGTPSTPAEPLPAELAQKIKQGTYTQLGSKAYGELKSADIEGQKALARGIKEEIAQAFPEISDLNARESRLYDLQPVIERAVNRISNHQLMGIGTPAVAGAAGVISGSGKLGAAAGAIKLVLDNPAVKSQLAIALSKGGRIPPATAMSRIADYTSALNRSAARGIALGGLPAIAQPPAIAGGQ